MAHVVERTLYGLMFAIPITGLALVLLSGESWELTSGKWQAPLELVDDDVLLAAHILTHVVFLLAVGIHVGMVLKHQIVNRDRLLTRMLRRRGFRWWDHLGVKSSEASHAISRGLEAPSDRKIVDTSRVAPAADTPAPANQVIGPSQVRSVAAGLSISGVKRRPMTHRTARSTSP